MRFHLPARSNWAQFLWGKTSKWKGHLEFQDKGLHPAEVGEATHSGPLILPGSSPPRGHLFLPVWLGEAGRQKC